MKKPVTRLHDLSPGKVRWLALGLFLGMSGLLFANQDAGFTRDESFYFAYGGDDAFVIVDMPDANAGLALSLAVNATAVVSLEMVHLITPADMDAAAQTTVKYRGPGQ